MPVAVLESFWTKYVTLGRFADKWWGTEPVGPFHRDSRDVVQSGTAIGHAIYQARIEISDLHLVEQLVGSGVLVRAAATPTDHRGAHGIRMN